MGERGGVKTPPISGDRSTAVGVEVCVCSCWELYRWDASWPRESAAEGACLYGSWSHVVQAFNVNFAILDHDGCSIVCPPPHTHPAGALWLPLLLPLLRRRSSCSPGAARPWWADAASHPGG